MLSASNRSIGRSLTVEAAILQLVEADVSLADRFAILISDSRRIQHHRLCLADRNAGARLPRSRPGRQPRRLKADQHPTVRALDLVAHSFAAVAPTSAKRLYMPALVAARLQSRHAGRNTHTSSKPENPQKSFDRDHAKACRPRKCPPKGKSHLDAKNRLINTDTPSVERA